MPMQLLVLVLLVLLLVLLLLLLLLLLPSGVSFFFNYFHSFISIDIFYLL